MWLALDFLHLRYKLSLDFVGILQHINQVLDLPVSDFILIPLQALNGVTLPPQVALQLSAKLIRHATTWSFHGSANKQKHNPLETT